MRKLSNNLSSVLDWKIKGRFGSVHSETAAIRRKRDGRGITETGDAIIPSLLFLRFGTSQALER
jgi:hypothetical protein